LEGKVWKVCDILPGLGHEAEDGAMIEVQYLPNVAGVKRIKLP
jgi:hypothetical protein